MRHLILLRRETLEQTQGWVGSGPWVGVDKIVITSGSTSDWPSLYACPQGWKLQGTDRAKKQTIALVSSCPVWSHGPLTTLLSGQNLLPLLLLRRWPEISISTWPCSLVAGSLFTSTLDTGMPGLVLCVCPFPPTRSIKQSPQRTWLVASSLKDFKATSSFLSIQEGTHPLHPDLS